MTTLLLLSLLGTAQNGAGPSGSGQVNRDLFVDPVHTRHALVIGNAAYPKWPLKNPVNDARAMASTLSAAGFSTYTATDLSLRNLEQAVSRLVAKVQQGDLVLFYYAGHGVQIDGDNYLVPIDFDAKDEADAKYSAYSASRVQERLERAGARVVILVLDACRNNPFQATRSIGSGLAAMGTGKGSFIAFATAPGKTADDNPRGANGLFTSHLVEALTQPGLTLDQVFNRVRERVYHDSQGRQVPWSVSSVIGDVYLRPVNAGAANGNPLAARRPEQAASGAAPENTLARRRTDTAPSLPAYEEAAKASSGPIFPAPSPLDQAAAAFKEQRWDDFLASARQALATGSTVPFAVGHHHTLVPTHASALLLTRETIAYQSLGANCNQPNFSYPIKNLISAQVTTNAGGEVFLNIKVLDEKGKQRNLNFADPDSQVTEDANGLPKVLSPPKAYSQLSAIAQLLNSR
jgi:uncharacterized caspase-like protein